MLIVVLVLLLLISISSLGGSIGIDTFRGSPQHVAETFYNMQNVAKRGHGKLSDLYQTHSSVKLAVDPVDIASRNNEEPRELFASEERKSTTLKASSEQEHEEPRKEAVKLNESQHTADDMHEIEQAPIGLDAGESYAFF